LPLPVGAIIKIGIPSEIQIYEEGTDNPILNSVYGLNPIYRVPQMLITDRDAQIVKISALVPTFDYFVNEDNPINFELMDIINPEATGATSPFTVQVFDQESYMICEVFDNASLFYQASVGQLKEVTVDVNNSKTRESENIEYTFSFITKNDLV
jgi:hypothetical protein